MPLAVGHIIVLLNMANKNLSSFLWYCQKFLSGKNTQITDASYEEGSEKSNLGTVYKIAHLHFSIMIGSY